jgi:hypothetical protein
MKKYLVAAVVAVMVFAFAAFAAPLNVGDSVLAAGEGEVTDCGPIDVKSWGVDAEPGGEVSFVRLAVGDCTEDHVLFASALDVDGNQLTRSGEYRIGSNTDGNGWEQVAFQGSFPPEDIHGLRVTVHSKAQ